MIQMHQIDSRDEVVEIEAEVEIDVGGWDMQQPEGLITPDRELEFDK